jgi:hypothetical protein
VLFGDDLQRGVLVDAVAGVDEPAVDLAGERGLRQAGADRCGDLAHGHDVVEIADAAVGKRDGDGMLDFCVHAGTGRI